MTEWWRGPTFSYPPSMADKVIAALQTRNAGALERLRVVWFDWRTHRWRRNHRAWMFSDGWKRAPEYGGRLTIRRATAVTPRKVLCIKKVRTWQRN